MMQYIEYASFRELKFDCNIVMRVLVYISGSNDLQVLQVSDARGRLFRHTKGSIPPIVFRVTRICLKVRGSSNSCSIC